MSMLRLFDPDCVSANDIPDVIPLPRTTVTTRAWNSVRVTRRARVRFANRCCPGCHRATVAPVELSDCEFDRNGREIPGTATIVAFRCERCEHQWPASRPDAG